MTNRFLRRGIVPLTIIVFVFSALALASDKVMHETQGKVMTVDFEKKILVVYETDFSWDQNTAFCNKKGVPIGINELKPNARVDILWEYATGTKKRIAKKVYVLSKHIGEED